ncbi:MAG: DUF2489 domain-containing protein [Pasteurellaceae bacterium]|nr:DUF2489 domain-containing protein [Pasteurellaceae bacterium]
MWRFFLFILAILILLSLTAYAISLCWKLHQQKQQLQQAKNARYQRVIESIEIIAKAMETEQCGLSEGVLRLKPLLDVLGKKLSQFPAMWALFEVVQDMPILEARKQLKRNERMKFDLERESKEAELDAQIKNELVALRQQIEQVKQELK